MSRAVFLDRDGTLVEPRHYPARPEDLVVYPGLDRELRHLQTAGFALVVVTNQSGLARGLFTESDLDAMHEYLRELLARSKVRVDGFYFCPHHPEGTVPSLAIECGCRKPKPGMLLQAAADLQIDLHRSWFVGDILDDVEAGALVGCATILVDQGTESVPANSLRKPNYVAPSTRDALRMVRWLEGLGPEVDTTYVPREWLAGSEFTGEGILSRAY